MEKNTESNIYLFYTLTIANITFLINVIFAIVNVLMGNLNLCISKMFFLGDKGT